MFAEGVWVGVKRVYTECKLKTGSWVKIPLGLLMEKGPPCCLLGLERLLRALHVQCLGVDLI